VTATAPPRINEAMIMIRILSIQLLQNHSSARDRYCR
jgi:hypothetical protein